MVDMACNRCGAKVTGATVAESLDWDREHDKHCSALDSTTNLGPVDLGAGA